MRAAYLDSRVVLRMGLVSMILELRDNSERDAFRERGPVTIDTKMSSPEDHAIRNAISLRTFAMRLDSAKRRSQKLG